MKPLIRNRMLSLAGAAIGGILGYLYYKFIGCETGTCPITSRPLSSIIYGAILGYLLMSVFEKK